MKVLTIVVPVGPGDLPRPVLQSVDYPAEFILSADPEGRGAPWARNQGAALARTPLLLFSDADIRWRPGAIRSMVEALEADPGAAFAFGAYEMEMADGSTRWVAAPSWSLRRLHRNNFVSTMAVLRREWFPGWDEDLKRLQDWDLWLTVAERGGRGVDVGGVMFTTWERPGITYGGGLSWERAREIVARKHGLA